MKNPEAYQGLFWLKMKTPNYTRGFLAENDIPKVYQNANFETQNILTPLSLYPLSPLSLESAMDQSFQRTNAGRGKGRWMRTPFSGLRTSDPGYLESLTVHSFEFCFVTSLFNSALQTILYPVKVSQAKEMAARVDSGRLH